MIVVGISWGLLWQVTEWKASQRLSMSHPQQTMQFRDALEYHRYQLFGAAIVVVGLLYLPAKKD